MSTETLEWLRDNTRIGFTDKRGPAWHAARGADGEYKNHYTGPVPVEDVEKLFDFPLIEGDITITAITDDGVIQFLDPTRKAIVRADTATAFGIFKRGFRIHHLTEWLIEKVSLVIDESKSDLAIGSAGLLKGGAQAFVQFEVPETFTTKVGGVKHRPYLGAATSHDGSLASTFVTGTTVWFCDNTMHAGLHEMGRGQAKFRHSSNSLGRIGEVRTALGLVVETIADEFDRQVSQLLDDAVDEARWKAFLAAYTNPTKKELTGRSLTMADTKTAELNRLWNYDERVAPWRNTAYGVVAATNTYGHHIRSVKNVTRPERNLSGMVLGEWEKSDAATLKLLSQV